MACRQKLQVHIRVKSYPSLTIQHSVNYCFPQIYIAYIKQHNNGNDIYSFTQEIWTFFNQNVDECRYLSMRSTRKNEIHMIISKTFNIFHKASRCAIRITGINVMNLHVRVPTHFVLLSTRRVICNNHQINRLKICTIAENYAA